MKGKLRFPDHVSLPGGTELVQFRAELRQRLFCAPLFSGGIARGTVRRPIAALRSGHFAGFRIFLDDLLDLLNPLIRFHQPEGDLIQLASADARIITV